jgi:DNA-binding NtrC family response regulator
LQGRAAAQNKLLDPVGGSAIRIVGKFIAGQSANGDYIGSVQMAGQSLLIVESYESVAGVTAAALAEHFVKITIAGTLAEARRLHLAAAAPFDLVICSQNLPDGLGSDFKRWLDELSSDHQLPFVLMAGSLPGLRRSKSNFVILSKPFMIEELLQAIDEARELVDPPPKAATAPPPAT